MSKAKIEENLAKFDGAFCDFLYKYMEADNSEIFDRFFDKCNQVDDARKKLTSLFDELNEMHPGCKGDNNLIDNISLYESVVCIASAVLPPVEEFASIESHVHNVIRSLSYLLTDAILSKDNIISCVLARDELDLHAIVDLVKIFHPCNPMHSVEGLIVEGPNNLNRVRMLVSLFYFLLSKYELH